MEPVQTAEVVKVYPTAIWIESDFTGDRRVMLQHEGCDAFPYATFHYDYRYTSNAGTWAMAQELAKRLGAKEPIEERAVPLPSPASLWQRIRFVFLR